MSIQPDRSLLDALRDALRKAEADSDSETTALAELKRILRQRIAQLESAEHMLEFKWCPRPQRATDTTHLDKKP
ncbi:hypothetical protein P8935_16210 [Telmatobacter sp. DSM 110680]|uniref:Transposase C of IS166 homeodomain-containing protein n=1 Tax=Telmatobacter sp. DSM 110680 TaxID=3036704 RepID=A0AAU7DFJ3_9BACT